MFVHEGQAASGHYWAYVYNTRHRKWLKYNDITVTEATWQELTSDSYGGGRNNASAYCLMYIDDNCSDLVRGKDMIRCVCMRLRIRKVQVDARYMYCMKCTKSKLKNLHTIKISEAVVPNH